MSEARCRADNSDDLSERNDDGVPSWEFESRGDDIDRLDDDPPIDNDDAHRLHCCRDFGEPGPDGEFVMA